MEFDTKTVETVTEHAHTEKKEEVKAEKPMIETFHTEGVIPEEFGGLSAKQLDAPIKEGVRYYVDYTNLTPHPANARMWSRAKSLEPKIREVDAIEENLIVMVRGAVPTLRQILNGEVTAAILKGHQRRGAVELIHDTDPAYWERVLKNRVPIEFEINPTKERELMLLHDHAGVNPLTEAEIAHQFGQLLAVMEFPQVVLSMAPLLARVSKAEKKMALLEAQLASKQITQRDYRRSILAALRGRSQTYQHIKECPEEIRNYFYLLKDPVLCVKKGVEYPKVELANTDFTELAKIARNDYRLLTGEEREKALAEGMPHKKAKEGDLFRPYKTHEEANEASLARFHEMIKTRLAEITTEEGDGDGEGDGGDTGPTGRAMSAKEIEKKIPYLDSVMFRRILEGVAGNREAREEWPGIDADLSKFEKALKADSDRVRQLLSELVPS